MHQLIALITLFGLVACKKDAETPSSTAQAPAPVAPAPAPPPAAAPTPAPTPVQLTAEQLKPTCAKLFPAAVAAKTHDANAVKETAVNSNARGGMAVCEFSKDGEVVGTATIACNPDLDPTAIQRERAAMTKAVDMTPSIGRGGYRLSSNFTFIDDETPCRLMVNWMSTPPDDVWPDKLRAIIAAVNPDTLK